MRKFLVCLLVLLMLAVTVSAQSSFVSDEINLLTPEQSASFNERLNAYHNNYNVSVALDTTDDLSGKSIEVYANDYYASSGFDNDCAMLVICEAEGQWYIYTHGLCAEMITDEEVAQIGAVILDALQAGEYHSAVETFVQMTAEPVCQQVQAMNAEAEAIHQSQNRAVIYGLVGGLVVGIAVAVLLGFAAKYRRAGTKTVAEEPQYQEQNMDT